MNTEKQFIFMVINQRTCEIAHFSGQGTNVKDAFADAIKNARDSFRPKDGKERQINTVRVQASDGKYVSRTLDEFESDIPYKDDADPTPTD